MIFLPIYHAGIKACMEANHPVDEEPYEINLDNHGFRDGPRTGRLRASEKVSSLTVERGFLEDHLDC